MPRNSPQTLLSIEGLMTALWERSDCSVEHLCDELLAAEILLNLARTTLGFLQIRHRADPCRTVSNDVLLHELNTSLHQARDRIIQEETDLGGCDNEELFHFLNREMPRVRWVRMRKG